MHSILSKTAGPFDWQPLSKKRQAQLAVAKALLFRRMHDILRPCPSDQKRRRGIVLRAVFCHGAAVVVGITIQTPVSAGIIDTDIISEQTGTFLSLCK